MLWPCHADMLMCLQTNQGVPCFLSCKKYWNISLESQLCSNEQATSAQSSLGCRKTTRQPYRCIVVALDAFWRVIHNCLHDSFTSTLHKQTILWCSQNLVCLRCCNWNCLEEVYQVFVGSIDVTPGGWLGKAPLPPTDVLIFLIVLVKYDPNHPDMIVSQNNGHPKKWNRLREYKYI